MPKALSGAFGVTINRIRNQKPAIARQAMDILKLVFLTPKILSLNQLRHALAVEPEDNDLDWENFVDAQFSLDCCLGLVIQDESTSEIRLVHKSLQDYLQKEYDEAGIFCNGHYEIAHTFILYMAFDCYDAEIKLAEYPADVFTKYALLEYAARHWIYHAQKSASRVLDEFVIALLLEKYNTHSVFRHLLAWQLAKDRPECWRWFRDLADIRNYEKNQKSILL
jgi:hypothetical protein